MIRKVTTQDALRICEIYNYYVLHTAISFEIETVGEVEMSNRIATIISDGYPYYVYENEEKIVGYCYLSSWKSRCAYRTTAEISIYIDQTYRNKGIGSVLMQHTLNNIGTNHLHTIIAGIALPNHTNVALHEKFGFHKISHFREVGYKFDKWQDVGHWQLILKNKIRINLKILIT